MQVRQIRLEFDHQPKLVVFIYVVWNQLSIRILTISFDHDDAAILKFEFLQFRMSMMSFSGDTTAGHRLTIKKGPTYILRLISYYVACHTARQ